MAKKKRKKKQAAARRQQKQAAKRRAREKEVAKRPRKGPASKEPLPGLETFVQSGNYAMWLSHGVNFLASNYEEGLWQPVFEDIYKPTCQPTRDSLVNHMVKTYQNEETGEWKEGSEVLVAWVALKPETAYLFFQEALRHVEGDEETLWKPHSGLVWKFFNDVREELSTQSS